MQFFYAIWLSLLSLWFFFPAPAYSNHTEPPFLPNAQSPNLLCTIAAQTFIDNTEFFNKIMEGQTIFGFYFLPGLTLLTRQNMALRLGVVWDKRFGHIKPWHGIKPTFSILYKKPSATFAIGILSLQDYPVTLLEPLHLLDTPCIEGFHFKLSSHKSYVSGWLNWLTLLAKKKQKPERFTVHLDGVYHCHHANNKVTASIPFQLAVYHLGGQGISVKDYSLWCGANGLSINFGEPFRKKIKTASYLFWNRYVKEVDRPFTAGWGQLHMIDFSVSSINLSFSYWYGNNFSSENMGYPLYQSIRIEAHRVVHYERIRSLFFLSLSRNWLFDGGLKLYFALRPYYDFKNRCLEYSFVSRLTYSGTFKLAILAPIASASSD